MSFSSSEEKIQKEKNEQKMQISDLLTNEIHSFCIKRAKIDLGRKSLSEDEQFQLINCYSKFLGSLEIVIMSWNHTTQELADSLQKFGPKNDKR